MGKDKKDKKRKHDDTEDLQRKAEKKAKKLAKRLKEKGGMAGYTNEDNPFGDANLSEKFVWGKKLEKQIKEGVDLKELDWKAEKERQTERMVEIEKVKKRREDRERERAQMEEEMEQMQRERSYAEAAELEKKEEEFHLKQAQVRSEIRVKEGRAKPIDIIARNLHLADDFDPHSGEPENVFRGLTLAELEDLKADIQAHLEIDTSDEAHARFWRAMLVVCNAEVEETRRNLELDKAQMRGEQAPRYLAKRDLQSGIEADVEGMLEGKGYPELQELYEGIAEQVASGEGEVEYWEAVLKRISVAKSRALLSMMHEELMEQHADRQRKRLESGEAGGTGDGTAAEGGGGEGGEGGGRDDDGAAGGDGERSDEEEDEPAEEYDPSMSPPPARITDQELRRAVDVEDDMAALARTRQEVLEKDGNKYRSAAAKAVMAGPSETDGEYNEMLKNAQDRTGGMVPAMFRHISSAGPPPDDAQAELKQQAVRVMGAAAEGDTHFGGDGEVELDNQVYWWHDKYRPRKPKYFNRVHTGYEWNKYNQTHYDHDNPPPKVVQGYKFNIFYPDLIDKSKAPTYTLERDDAKGETLILRFHAGPPYEDIAFRIVNREWEYSHKKGFKCTFERGILHLYINFARHRYRR